MQAQFHHQEQQDMQQEQCKMQREQCNNQIDQLLLVNNQEAGQTPQTPRIDEGPCTSLLIAHPVTPDVTNFHQTLLQWLIILPTWMSCLSKCFQQ
jgi:hypothetical protein